jgi:hypothetical protein
MPETGYTCRVLSTQEGPMRIRGCAAVPVCLLLLAGGPAWAAGEGREGAEKAQIERVVRASIGWALNKDQQLLYGSMAQDSAFFIFHPDSKSTIVGFEAFRRLAESVFMSEKFKATDFAVRDLRVHLSKGRDVAWYSAYLDDHGEWDGRKTGWDDARWTGVLEKRRGKWVIAQMHFSLASDVVKAEAEGRVFPVLGGPYLGQTPPGPKAELFAPGIVCTGMNERDVAVTPDGREMYFGVSFGRVVTIMVTRLENGRWTQPAAAPFAADLKYFHFEPCLSADGSRMLFLTNRPSAGEEPKPGWTQQNIWAVDRKEDGRWGEPYDLGGPINTGDAEFFPSLTRDGTLYFTRARAGGGKTVIMRARLRDGRYQEPEPLPEPVNGRGDPYNAFVAPDESYLIACVDGRDDSVTPGRPNYYVFFRDAGGRWSDGANLGERVNFRGAAAASPYVSPDGRYFFFSSTKAREVASSPDRPATLRALGDSFAAPENGNADIYWMEASFFDALRPARRE